MSRTHIRGSTESLAFQRLRAANKATILPKSPPINRQPVPSVGNLTNLTWRRVAAFARVEYNSSINISTFTKGSEL